MRSQFLHHPDDMQWLREVHLRDVPVLGKPLTECRSAIIEGNEDCPDKITLYWARSPLAYEMPAAVLERSEDGELVEVNS